ncbi:C4-type zinc finger protein, DksA/TraR family [hydrothermal vent metagenome]|uniref:C4-type zinc finger protein, DksA/TraR family n=1 Tax=hydrothermal vent metagenome TaxID=652676 RepID=A0A1W1CNZ6_9ZZZZ
MKDTPFQNNNPYVAKKGEEFMNTKQLKHFKESLLQWRNSLVDDAKNTIEHMQEDVSQVSDTNDRATLEEEFALELRTRDRERKLIEKINQSLRLIDLGEYGYCQTCGAEITLERLNARLTASKCIDCKTIEEKKHT